MVTGSIAFAFGTATNPVPATTTEVNGVTLTYRDAHYRFVPDDYEKSDEEKQQEKSGELVISYYG